MQVTRVNLISLGTDPSELLDRVGLSFERFLKLMAENPALTEAQLV